MAMQMGSSQSISSRRQDFTTPTESQTSALARYVQSPDLPAPLREGIRVFLVEGRMTYSIASETISLVKIFLERGDKIRKITEGVYRNPRTGKFYQVKRSQAQRLYGMEMNLIERSPRGADGTWAIKPKVEWVYKPGIMNDISPDWRVTREQAKEFADWYGCCIKCGTELTKQESIDRGMGDTCAKSF